MGKTPLLQTIDGVLAPGFFCPDAWRRAILYKPKPGDVFISTFPKCGTTWTQHIVCLILKRGEPFDGAAEFFKRSPFIELAGPEAVDNMLHPGVIKTHFAFDLTPYSPEAKYIYVVRNPKDTCVSLFHHDRNFPGYEFHDGQFDDFFEEFYHGRTEWGHYMDHLMGWYAHKDDPNVLFITFESMKRDHAGAVKKIAAFLGKEYEEMLEKDPEILKRIVEYTSVQYMKKNSDTAFSDMFGIPEELIDQNPDVTEGLKAALKGLRIRPNEKREFNFIRKGIVGDWKNLFTEEHSKRLDEMVREKAGSLDVNALFEGALD